MGFIQVSQGSGLPCQAPLGNWLTNREYQTLFRSDGGVPPPTALEASVEVRGLQVRQLIPVTEFSLVKAQLPCKLIEMWTQVGDLEKRGEHLEQEFKLDPRVSERSDSDTFAVCKADQVHLTMMQLF